MAIVNNCAPSVIDANPWCLNDLFTVGEGKDAVLIPISVWGQLKSRWKLIQTGGSTTIPVLSDKPRSPHSFIYNEPTTDPETTLFPDGETDKVGLYFSGNTLIFNPTVGSAVQTDGVPYNNSIFSLPVGSSMNYYELIRYINANAWILLKTSADGRELHAYGGPRGLMPVPDAIAEQLFSGNNDAKGQTTVQLQVDKAAFAIEFFVLGSDTTNQNALVDLLEYARDNACLPNGVDDQVNVPVPPVAIPTSVSIAAAGATENVTFSKPLVSLTPNGTAAWLTIGGSGTAWTLTASANSTGNALNATLTATDADGLTTTVAVTQASA